MSPAAIKSTSAFVRSCVARLLPRRAAAPSFAEFVMLWPENARLDLRKIEAAWLPLSRRDRIAAIGAVPGYLAGHRRVLQAPVSARTFLSDRVFDDCEGYLLAAGRLAKKELPVDPAQAPRYEDFVGLWPSVTARECAAAAAIWFDLPVAERRVAFHRATAFQWAQQRPPHQIDLYLYLFCRSFNAEDLVPELWAGQDEAAISQMVETHRRASA